MMLKGSIHQGSKTILNMHALDNRASKYTKQNLNGQRTKIDRVNLQKISKNIEELNYAKQLDIIHIYIDYFNQHQQNTCSS